MEIFSAFKGLSLKSSRSHQNGFDSSQPDSKPPRPPKNKKKSLKKDTKPLPSGRESRARSHGLSSRESSRAGSPISIRSTLSLNIGTRWAEFRGRRSSSPAGSDMSLGSQSVVTSPNSKVTSPESLSSYRVVDSIGPLSQRHLSLRRSLRDTRSPSWSSAGSSVRWSSGRFPSHRLPSQRRPNSAQFFSESNAASAILSACKFPVDQFRPDLYLDPNQGQSESSDSNVFW